MANNPPELRYTQEHEWAKQEGTTVRVGITHYAQEQLGDVVFVELPKPGTRVTASTSFGVVESVKAVSDLFAPVSGEVIEINAELTKKPELVNQDPFGDAWLIKVRLTDASQLDDLMDPDAYDVFLASAA